MGQVIQVTSRKFFNQLTNGENFGSNTSDFATHLLGAIGERVKADITFSISWNSKASSQNIFKTLNLGGGSFSISRASGSFIDDGLKIGDTVDCLNQAPSPTTVCLNGTITFIDDLLIHILGTYVHPGGYGNFAYLNVLGKTPLTAMKLFYGIVENSQPASFVSKLDNTTQGFYASGLTTSPTVATPLGNPRSWFFNDVTNIYKVSTSGYVQTFRFTHEFVITPFFLDGEQSNIENIIDPSYFQQNESLKYVFNAEINTALSNPNTVHDFMDDQLLGEVAYYNENFNGLQNKFSFEDLTYRDAVNLQSCDGLLITQKTRVNFTLVTTGTFTNNTTAAIPQVFYLSPLDEYSNTIATDGAENFMMYDKRAVCASVPVAVTNGDMTNVKLTYVDATHIDVEFDFEFTTAEKLRLTTSGQYCISILVETVGLSAVNSDKVRLKIDVNTFDLYTDITQLMSFGRKSQMWIHPYHPMTSSGFSSLKTWIEDAIMTKAICSLNYVQYPNANIKSIIGRMIAYNTADERWFELDSYEFDLSGVQTISGAQQISIDTPRAFQLEPGDPYLNAKIETGLGVPGSYQDYNVWIPWKMRYEDFIANPNVPADFFDSSEENNNQNYKSSNYYLNPDWEVHIVYDFVINNGTANVDTTYRYHFGSNQTHDYDVDGNTPVQWTAAIKLYRASNNSLLSTGSTGLILTNEDTLFEAVFTPVAGLGYLLNPWAVLRMEVLNSGQNGIFELSYSGRTEPANNLLVPETGQTGAKITQSAPNVKVTGIIKSSLIDPSAIYKLSARLGGIQYGGPGEGTMVRTEGITPRILISEGGKILLTEVPVP
jgi:hypothetical protein